MSEVPITKETEVLNDNDDDQVSCVPVPYHIDRFMSNPDKWPVYFIYLLVQCVLGLALFLTLITNSVGNLTFNALSMVFDYFMPIDKVVILEQEALSNCTLGKSINHWNIGSCVLNLIILILLRIAASIYIYVKNRYAFNVQELQ